jgi:hypothetical protein
MVIVSHREARHGDARAEPDSHPSSARTLGYLAGMRARRTHVRGRPSFRQNVILTLKMTSISDISDSISVAGQTLSTPLLSNLPEHEGDECDADTDYYVEKEGCLPCPLKIVVGNEELDEVSGDDSSQSSWWNENCVALVVLSGLLSVQFVAVFCMPGAEATTTTGPRWSVASYGIMLFVAVAIVYHKTVKDHKLACWVVVLAPEILTSIILGLVILDHLIAAFLFMLVSTLCLAILAEAISYRGLIATSIPAEEDECKQLQDKLDGNLFKEGLRLRTSTQIV